MYFNTHNKGDKMPGTVEVFRPITCAILVQCLQMLEVRSGWEWTGVGDIIYTFQDAMGNFKIFASKREPGLDSVGNHGYYFF